MFGRARRSEIRSTVEVVWWVWLAEEEEELFERGWQWQLFDQRKLFFSDLLTNDASTNVRQWQWFGYNKIKRTSSNKGKSFEAGNTTIFCPLNECWCVSTARIHDPVTRTQTSSVVIYNMCLNLKMGNLHFLFVRNCDHEVWRPFARYKTSLLC